MDNGTFLLAPDTFDRHVSQCQFLDVGVDRELGGPVQIFEPAIVAIYGKRTLDAASDVRRPINADGPADKGVSFPRCRQVARVRGYFKKVEPALGYLRHAGQANPIHGCAPVGALPSRESATSPLSAYQTVGQLACSG